MTSDLQSKCLMENGYVFEGPGRVCTIVIHSQNAGVLTMKDGGSGGTTKIEVGYGSNANFTFLLVVMVCASPRASTSLPPISTASPFSGGNP
jgi:hypothetical protein